MGALARFDLPDLMRRFGVVHFVETGTGTGASLGHAAGISPPFRSLHSCEIEEKLASDVSMKFIYEHRVHVSTGKSLPFLLKVCNAVPANEPILFWLDAHFPGADYGMHGYGDESDDAVRLPLAQELAVIAWKRPQAPDVIICDDLRIYADGPFSSGNLPADVRPYCPQRRDASFFEQIMGATHDVRFLYDHEGYVIMTPKQGTPSDA